MNRPVSRSRGGQSARVWVALGFSAACWILPAACDDARTDDSTRQQGTSPKSTAGKPGEEPYGSAASRLSSGAKARHLLETLKGLDSEKMDAALANPAEFELIMSLDPDAIMGFYRDVIKANESDDDPERSKAGNMLLSAYFREMSVRSPELLAAYVEKTDGGGNSIPLVFLAESSPELAFSTIQEIVSARKHESRSVLYFQVTTEVIANVDPQLAIRLINDSTVRDREVMERVMLGFAGVNLEQVSPSEAAALLSRFSPERLAAHPEVARVVQFYYNSPPSDILPLFPLDGAPWQRAGAIAYLEAAAFKGMNGDMYVTEFLESPQASLLTDEERARLRHILRKP